jgi:hypothetical protein
MIARCSDDLEPAPPAEKSLKNTLLGIAASAVLATAPALAVAAEEILPPLQDAAVEFARVATAPKDSLYPTGEVLLLPVTLTPDANLEAAFDDASGRLRVLYRMAFSQLTEGWNWHPQARPDVEDYYRFKYLPIKSFIEDRAGYRFEDKIGEPQDIAVRWRYDYFFAFDNLYDFYPRSTDDDAGFAAEITLPRDDGERLLGGDLRMALRGRLAQPCHADSTTFWKATYSKPVDFTLKKRYLVGSLEEIVFYDVSTGQVLARLRGRK